MSKAVAVNNSRRVAACRVKNAENAASASAANKFQAKNRIEMAAKPVGNTKSGGSSITSESGSEPAVVAPGAIGDKLGDGTADGVALGSDILGRSRVGISWDVSWNQLGAVEIR